METNSESIMKLEKEKLIVDIVYRHELDKFKDYIKDLDAGALETALYIALYKKYDDIVTLLIETYHTILIQTYPGSLCFVIHYGNKNLLKQMTLTPEGVQEVLEYFGNRSHYDDMLAYAVSLTDWHGYDLPMDIIKMLTIYPLPKTFEAIDIAGHLTNVKIIELLYVSLQAQNYLISNYLFKKYGHKIKRHAYKLLNSIMTMGVPIFEYTYKKFNLDPNLDLSQKILILAIKKGFKEIVQFLLEQGTDPTIKTASGRTILNIINEQPVAPYIKDLVQKYATNARGNPKNGRWYIAGDVWPRQIINKYDIYKYIARGAFGKIYLAINKENEQQVAIKKSIYSYNPQEQNEIMDTEKAVPDNPLFLKTFEILVDDDNYIYQVMEYIPWKDLLDTYNAQGHQFNLCVIFRIIYQLIEAVKILHERNIAHRDIKLENILIDSSLSYIKLIDFGLSCNIKKLLEQNCRTRSGTPMYLPPILLFDYRTIKILDNLETAKVQDIWAIAVVIYVLLYGKYPYNPLNGPKEYKRLPYMDLATTGRRFFNPLLTIIFDPINNYNIPTIEEVKNIIQRNQADYDYLVERCIDKLVD